MTRLGSIVTGGTLLALSALPALAQQAGNAPPPDYYYYRHMHFGPFGFFGPLLWVVVIFCLVALFMRFGWWGHHGYRRRPGGALDILEERFARGEIDKAEFDERRKALGR